MTFAVFLCHPRRGVAAGARLSWPFGPIPFQPTDTPSPILVELWALHKPRRLPGNRPLFDAPPSLFVHSLEPAA